MRSTDKVSLIERIRGLQDTEKRDELIRGGEQHAAKFSWKKCVDETFAFYKEVETNVRSKKSES